MSAQIGQKRYLSYNLGSYESPTWVTINLTKDAKIPMADGESDASFRGNGGFDAAEPGLTALRFEFNMIEDRADSAYLALRAAKLAKSALEFWATDLPPDQVGANGPRATCKIFKFDLNESLAEVTTVDVMARPCVSSHPPEWFTRT